MPRPPGFVGDAGGKGALGMTAAERIKEVLYQFEHAGLIWHDMDRLLDCFSDTLLGVGLGEQGVVHSKEEVRRLLAATRKETPDSSHSLRCENVEIVFHAETFASLCAEVIVTAITPRGQMESRFYQSLTLHCLEGDWKVCALHASTPVISEEAIEAYPLKIAEKTLESLRKKIGEEVYQAEEQYRQAVLADTIAFYVINLTTDTIEKCQLNGDHCIYAPAGSSMQQLIADNVAQYVEESDRACFCSTFSQESICRAYERGSGELSCEYRLRTKQGALIWASSVLRLIAYAESGDRKGILYVRDISKPQQERAKLLDRAARDGMTQLYNSASYIGAVEQILQGGDQVGGVLVMLDVDDFKTVNDTYGHPVGDEVLVRIAQTIRSFCWESTWVGRLGGDEFSIYSPHGGGADWETELGQLLAAIAAIRLPELPELRTTCSIGVAYRRAGETQFQELYKKADKALYHSKNRGKGIITVYDPAVWG